MIEYGTQLSIKIQLIIELLSRQTQALLYQKYPFQHNQLSTLRHRMRRDQPIITHQFTKNNQDSTKHATQTINHQSISSSFQIPSMQQQAILLTSKLDSLSFSRWHFMVVMALGLVWIFDGYEVSLISIMSKQIQQAYSEEEYKALATAYQIGCIIGSLIFGVVSYVIGRRKVFMVTLGIYACGIVLSMFGMPFWAFFFGRFLTGISVGGQFTGIFTAIDQFLPPKVRGRVDIAIDGTWHLGGVLAALLNLFLGDFEKWRLLFGIGLIGIFALVCLRRSIPQSPRWLIMRGRKQQAKKIVYEIEYSAKNKKLFLVNLQKDQIIQSYRQDERQSKKIEQQKNEVQNQMKEQIESNYDQDRKVASSQLSNFEVNNNPQIQLQPQQQTCTADCRFYAFQIISVVLRIFAKHTKKFLLSSFLIFVQGFFFSSVYYRYPLILKDRFGFSESQISLYMLPLSMVSFISTLIVGVFFDTLGRKLMLLITYCGSGLILIICFFILLQAQTVFLLQIGMCVLFFFGSPASSSANLIASEIFPTYARSIILSLIFILGMLGGVFGVWLNYYWISGVLMILAGIAGYIWCPSVQGKSLQEISKPN